MDACHSECGSRYNDRNSTRKLDLSSPELALAFKDRFEYLGR
jgi:hypothetical protein